MRIAAGLRPVVLAALFFAVGGLPPLVSAETNSTFSARPSIFSLTELKSGDNGHYVTTANINNNAITVMVDTGASAVALSYEDADTAGLRPSQLTYDVPVSTANGATMAARVVLDKVEIDTVRVRDVEGFVMPEGAMNGSLLGMSFLGKLSSFKVEDGVLTLKN